MHTQSQTWIYADACSRYLPEEGMFLRNVFLLKTAVPKKFSLFPMQKVLNINRNSGPLRAQLFFSSNQLYNSLTSREA